MLRSLALSFLFACAMGIALGAAPASAKGVVRVQQSDGSVQVYNDVHIRVVRGKALYVRSPDGHGTMIVDNAACSYVDQLLRCLLYGVSLRQNGTTRPLDFERGTLYLNFTDDWQNMPHSSQGVRPHGVVMAMKTARGTYVTLHGAIDQDVAQ